MARTLILVKGLVPFRAGRGLSEERYLTKNTSTSVFGEKGEKER
jgi:hypothetical protein